MVTSCLILFGAVTNSVFTLTSFMIPSVLKYYIPWMAEHNPANVPNGEASLMKVCFLGPSMSSKSIVL